jgi:uncharacterized protein (TIGR02271 family)
MREVLVAVFDTPARTEQAESALQAADIPSSSMRRYHQGDTTIPGASRVGGEPSDRSEPAGGFWAWLTGQESDTSDWRDPAYEQDESLYDRTVAGGNTAIAVYVEQSEADHVMKLLADQHPVALQDSGAETGTAPAARATGAAPAAIETTGARTTSEQAEQTIPLAEEQVEVGKRRVEEPVRVRRYVVERPVERQVTLRDEKVEIERRKPATGTATGDGAFEERIVEVHEAHERPDVQKTAQVTEEAVIRKDVTEHAETVRDTVRKEQVEIDRPAGNAKR